MRRVAATEKAGIPKDVNFANKTEFLIDNHFTVEG